MDIHRNCLTASVTNRNRTSNRIFNRLGISAFCCNSVLDTTGSAMASLHVGLRSGPRIRSQRGCYDVVGFGGGVANQQTVKKKRRIHSAEFKARVAVEALKGIKTISQIA